MPPKIPPAWLLSKPFGVISSRCSLPRCSTTAKPSPISTPLTALIPIKAWAKSASSRSKTGSPKPTGTFSAITVSFAPIESPSFFNSRINSSNFSTALSSGQKNGLLFTLSQSILSIVRGAIFTSPIWLKKPRTSMPNCSRKYFFAIAPAATRIAVSRAEERPPPR